MSKIAASLICGDPLNLEKDINQLIEAKVDMIHFDVMDGLFVPRYGLYPEILRELTDKTDIPVDVHMMVQNPEDYIKDFAEAGADYYCVHYEACPNLHRTLKKIKDAGMRPGVALNYHTSESVLKYLVNDIEMVVLMAINPGIVGHKIIPGIYDKITATNCFLAQEKPGNNIFIEIDGGVTFESAPKMATHGADILVCGTGTIFRPQEDTIVNKVKELRKII